MKQLILYDWRGAGGLYTPLLPYNKFIVAQETIVRQHLTKKQEDTLILTTHPPTITMGARSLREQLISIRLLPPRIVAIAPRISDRELMREAITYLRQACGIDLVKTNRGGSVWYHDHGVLQLYIIMEVDPFGSRIVSLLEETLMHVLLAIGIPATRATEYKRHCDKRFLGVWVREKKIAAIGIRVRGSGTRFVSMFGASLNINPNQSTSNFVDPCGIPHCRTTSVAEELNTDCDVHHTSLLPLLRKYISDVFKVAVKI